MFHFAAVMLCPFSLVRVRHGPWPGWVGRWSLHRSPQYRFGHLSTEGRNRLITVITVNENQANVVGLIRFLVRSEGSIAERTRPFRFARRFPSLFVVHHDWD